MQSYRPLLWVVLASLTAIPGIAQQNAPSNGRTPVLTLRSASRRTVPTGQAVVTVNGTPVNFEGTPLLQAHGTLLVPLRAIGEALKARVTFDPASSMVSASHGGYTMRLLDGTYSLGGRTLVPLRALSESLGVKVSVAGTPKLLLISLTIPTGHPEPLFSQPTNAPRDQGAPADGGATGATTSANITHNLNQLNALRARAGVAPLTLDAGLCDFARQGSLMLLQTHTPHGHFKTADVWSSGFQSAAAENQGDPHGWFPGPVNQAIDQILQAMMDEGPGGGHHDNILNPAYHRVGIGLIQDNRGRLYLTNDFSG